MVILRIHSPITRLIARFEMGTPSNIYCGAKSYICANFGAFVKSVTIPTLRDPTIKRTQALAGTSKG